MRRRYSRILMLSGAAAAAGALAWVVYWWERPAEVWKRSTTSVYDLMEWFPALATFEPTGCDVTARTFDVRLRLIPAPSDREFRLVGTVTLSDKGMASLRQAVEWHATEHPRLPRALQEIIPVNTSGPLVSARLHESEVFRANRTYRNGLVVLPANGPNVMYIAASDDDHMPR